MRKIAAICTITLLMFLFQFCAKNDESSSSSLVNLPILPTSVLNYAIDYPTHINTSLALNDNTPSDNPITNIGATLGRVLFYDKQLSANNSVSCASCH